MKPWVVLSFLLLSKGVFGSLTSFEAGGGVGYRQDALESIFKTSGRLGSKLDYKEIKSIDADGKVRLFFKNFMARGSFDYGWIQSGKLDMQFSLDTGVGAGPSDPLIYIFPFNFAASKIRGHLFDIDGGGGYAIPFYEQENCGLYLIPEAGYSCSTQKISSRSISPESSSKEGSLLGVSELSFAVNSIGPMNRTWYGPYVGGDACLLWRRFFMDIAYYYHFLTLKQKLNLDAMLDIFVLPVPGLVRETFIDAHNQAKVHGLHGNRVTGRIGYEVASHFRLAVSGNYFGASFKGKTSKLDQTFLNVPPGTSSSITHLFSFDGYWHMYSITGEASLSF